MPALTVLIVHSESSKRELWRKISSECRCKVLSTSSPEEALKLLDRLPVDIVIAGLASSDSGSFEFLNEIRERHPKVSVVPLQEDRAAEAVPEAPSGAVEDEINPVQVTQLRSEIRRIIRSRNFAGADGARTQPPAEPCGFGGLIGASAEMQGVYRLIAKVSQHPYPVLILGESGTGKELVARSIHLSGPRREKPFVPVDCSSLAPTLIESELFGHVKGAFTGAYRSKPGLVESAGGGTLFLDEIGDLPLELQSKLLRIVQENEIRPLGSNERHSVSVRVIAATNRNLERLVSEGTFREDLYFRLNVVQLTLPPLRNRKTDIPLLAAHFLEKFSGLGGRFGTVSDQALQQMLAYDWPGNVRELENAMEYASALGAGPILRAEHLPLKLQDRATTPEPLELELLPLYELERRAILLALREAQGDKTVAARLLGIGKSTLYRRLKAFGNPEFPSSADFESNYSDAF